MSLDSTASAASDDDRATAIRLYNETWKLLDQQNRTQREDDRMMHMAHASRFHWDTVGTDQQRAIGEWQISRVYAALGRASSAVLHAERAVEYAQSPGLDDWVVASAYEGLARAHAVAGDLPSARRARDRCRLLLDAIDDDEDRQVVAADLDSLAL